MNWNSPIAGFQYVLFERIVPEKNEHRYYYLAWWPTLFGMAVVRMYGRRGRSQRVLSEPFETLEAAWPFIRKHAKRRLRNGYRLVRVEKHPSPASFKDTTAEDVPIVTDKTLEVWAAGEPERLLLSLDISRGRTAWQEFLQENSTFRYIRADGASCGLVKEGDDRWYAQKQLNGRLRRRCLGLGWALTYQRLQAVAFELSQRELF